MAATARLSIPYSQKILSDAEVRARFMDAILARWPVPPKAVWTPVTEVAREWAEIRGNNDSHELRQGFADIVAAVQLRWSSALPPTVDALMETRTISWRQVESLKKMWTIAVSRLPRTSLLARLKGWRGR